TTLFRSPSLADILVSNLLNNAVKHNLRNSGFIAISVAKNKLTVVNTGLPLTVEPSKLFERFQKQNASTGSLGLGLAIVKKICEISQLGLQYHYDDGLHTISVTKSVVAATDEYLTSTYNISIQ